MTKSLKTQSLGSQAQHQYSASDQGLNQDSSANVCDRGQTGKLKPCLLFCIPIFFVKRHVSLCSCCCNCLLRTFRGEGDGGDALLQLETAKAEITTKTNCQDSLDFSTNSFQHLWGPLGVCVQLPSKWLLTNTFILLLHTGPIITELICRAGYSCCYGKVQCWAQLQC